jgi:hypothetical protein
VLAFALLEQRITPSVPPPPPDADELAEIDT